jgi:hypothetical protein
VGVEVLDDVVLDPHPAGAVEGADRLLTVVEVVGLDDRPGIAAAAFDRLDGADAPALVTTGGGRVDVGDSLVRIVIAGPCGIPSALMSWTSEFWIVTPEGVSEA